jgi:hypothetical protein
MKTQIRVIAVALSIGFTLTAAAAERIGALSLVGDQLTVVEYAMATGSHRDTNVRTPVPVKDSAFDNVALLRIDSAVRRARPEAEVALMRASDPKLHELQRKLLDSEDARPLLEAIAQMAAANKIDRLIVLTKHRQDTRIPMENGLIGSGRLEGLGWYVDRDRRVTDISSGAQHEGFVAPYVYVRLFLLDVKSLQVLADRGITLARPYLGDRAGPANPWNRMSGEQRGKVLEQLMENALAREVPQLLAAGRR